MRDFWIILKTSLLQHFGINRLYKKTKTKIAVALMSVLALLLVVVFMGFIFFYLFIFGSVLVEAGKGDIIYLLGVSAGAFFLLITTITKANGYVFQTKDFDMLMSLPVKPQVVVASKVASLALINYASFLIIYIPTLVAYSILATPSVLFFVLAIVVFFFVPLLPIAICSFLSFVLGLITSRLKHKNIISIVLLLVLFVGIMFLSILMGTMEEDPARFAEAIQNTMQSIYPPSIVAYEAVVEQNAFSLLLFITISVLPFALFVGIVGKYFVSINGKLARKTGKSNFHRHYVDDVRVVSEWMTLLKKEWKRYFSLPMYVINTIVGPVLIPIMAVIIYFQTQNAGDLGGELGEFIGLVLIGMATFMVGITATTSSSISLEGKQFWIIKSAPVQTINVFYGKIGLHLAVSMPFVILGTILGAILFKLSFMYIIFLFAIPTVFTTMTAVAGLYFNLLTPRFDWDSEIKVVKQSASVLLTMLYSFLATALVIVPAIFILINTSSMFWTLLTPTIVASIILLGTYMLLTTHGVRLYERLKA